jgi:hypothetical protein
LVSIGSTAWSRAQQTGGGTEKAIAALENQWLQSQDAQRQVAVRCHSGVAGEDVNRLTTEVGGEPSEEGNPSAVSTLEFRELAVAPAPVR